MFIQGLSYPSEIHSNVKYIETKNGILKEDPGQNYILSIIYEKSNDEIWKDREALDNIIKTFI